jgi:hypothetical protein
LDDLHHSGSLVDWENLGAFIKFGEGHAEDNFVNGLIWNFLQVIDSFKSTFQKDFEIIIVSNCSVDQLFLEEWELLEQVSDLTFANFTKSRIVSTGNRCASLWVIDESNFSKVITRR